MDALLFFSIYAASSSRVSLIFASAREEGNCCTAELYRAVRGSPRVIFPLDSEDYSEAIRVSAFFAGTVFAGRRFSEASLEFRHTLAQDLNLRLGLNLRFRRRCPEKSFHHVHGRKNRRLYLT